MNGDVAVKTVYLAGKCSGPKHDLVKGLSVYEWVCSDGANHSEHNWGACVFTYGALKRDFNEFCRDVLNRCQYLVAYLDVPTSYGSIVEIALASSMPIPALMVVETKKCKNDYEGCCWDCENCKFNVDMHDAYWFVSNLPYVRSVEVKEGDARLFFESWAKTESPIEKLFFEAAWSQGIVLSTQVEIEKYRVDFVVPDTSIIIEIDGHDYHKTREQRTKDASRDRDLMVMGYDVLRFTGSEIYSDVFDKVEEVERVLDVKGKTLA